MDLGFSLRQNGWSLSWSP